VNIVAKGGRRRILHHLSCLILKFPSSSSFSFFNFFCFRGTKKTTQSVILSKEVSKGEREREVGRENYNEFENKKRTTVWICTITVVLSTRTKSNNQEILGSARAPHTHSHIDPIPHTPEQHPRSVRLTVGSLMKYTY